MAELTSVGDYANVPANLADVLRVVADYWRFDADERAALAARGIDALPWPDLLRLHHLNCLEAFAAEHVLKRLDDDFTAAPPKENPALDRCRQTGNRLLAPDSPYRPRRATVWPRAAAGQAPPAPAGGELSNPSLTHLGCLEVLRVSDGRPQALAFVPFASLRGVTMSTPRYFRVARLAFADGRPDENVYLTLLYAATWRSASEFLRHGQMTFFLDYPAGDGPAVKYGLGVGQQDFALESGGGRTMFGHSSVAQIAFV